MVGQRVMIARVLSLSLLLSYRVPIEKAILPALNLFAISLGVRRVYYRLRRKCSVDEYGGGACRKINPIVLIANNEPSLE